MNDGKVMLLLFTVGDDRFGLDISRVVEVLPYVKLKRLPRTPAYVAGLFRFRGRAVPVVDLSYLLIERPARNLLSTRLILVNYPAQDGKEHLLGLIAEHATETHKFDQEEFVASGVDTAEGRLLGEVVMDDKGMIQRVEVEHLLPAKLHELLFTDHEGEQRQGVTDEAGAH